MCSPGSLHARFPSAGGQIHWSPKPSSPASTDFWPDTQSVDIELTAYVLLAYLSKPRVHAGDMTTAAGIVAWLTRQQNAYGGFASTQVTSSSLWIDILLHPRLAGQVLLRSSCSKSASVELMLSEGVAVSPFLGHSRCLASLSKICSKDVQHIRPGACEGEVPEGFREGFPSQPPEAAAGAAGSTDGGPGAAPGAGPRQQLCLRSGEVVGRAWERGEVEDSASSPCMRSRLARLFSSWPSPCRQC